MGEFYSKFLFRYQTNGASRKISINAYCIQEGIEYRDFIEWYRDNKKLDGRTYQERSYRQGLKYNTMKASATILPNVTLSASLRALR